MEKGPVRQRAAAWRTGSGPSFSVLGSRFFILAIRRPPCVRWMNRIYLPGGLVSWISPRSPRFARSASSPRSPTSPTRSAGSGSPPTGQANQAAATACGRRRQPRHRQRPDHGAGHPRRAPRPRRPAVRRRRHGQPRRRHAGGPARAAGRLRRQRGGPARAGQDRHGRGADRHQLLGRAGLVGQERAGGRRRRHHLAHQAAHRLPRHATRAASARCW